MLSIITLIVASVAVVGVGFSIYLCWRWIGQLGMFVQGVLGNIQKQLNDAVDVRHQLAEHAEDRVEVLTRMVGEGAKSQQEATQATLTALESLRKRQEKDVQRVLDYTAEGTSRSISAVSQHVSSCLAQVQQDVNALRGNLDAMGKGLVEYKAVLESQERLITSVGDLAHELNIPGRRHD